MSPHDMGEIGKGILWMLWGIACWEFALARHIDWPFKRRGRTIRYQDLTPEGKAEFDVAMSHLREASDAVARGFDKSGL